MTLREQLEYLRVEIPLKGDLYNASSREYQAFLERDFDRRLQLIQTEALIALAESMEKINVSES